MWLFALRRAEARSFFRDAREVRRATKLDLAVDSNDEQALIYKAEESDDIYTYYGQTHGRSRGVLVGVFPYFVLIAVILVIASVLGRSHHNVWPLAIGSLVTLTVSALVVICRRIRFGIACTLIFCYAIAGCILYGVLVAIVRSIMHAH